MSAVTQVSLGLVTPVLTLLPRAHARWEEDGDDPRRGADRGCRRCDRLPPRDLQRAHRHPERGGAGPWRPVLGSTRHVRVPGGGYRARSASPPTCSCSATTTRWTSPSGTARSTSSRAVASSSGWVSAHWRPSSTCWTRRSPIVAHGPTTHFGPCEPRFDRSPSYRGEHYAFDDVIVEPCAVQPRVPIWIGGRTRRSLRRAVELGDGWAPFGVSPDDVAAWLDAARDLPSWTERNDRMDVVLQPSTPLDPSTEAGAAVDALGGLGDAGATIVDVRLVHHSAEHCVEQLEAMNELMKHDLAAARARAVGRQAGGRRPCARRRRSFGRVADDADASPTPPRRRPGSSTTATTGSGRSSTTLTGSLDEEARAPPRRAGPGACRAADDHAEPAPAGRPVAARTVHPRRAGGRRRSSSPASAAPARRCSTSCSPVTPTTARRCCGSCSTPCRRRPAPATSTTTGPGWPTRRSR